MGIHPTLLAIVLGADPSFSAVVTLRSGIAPVTALEIAERISAEAASSPPFSAAKRVSPRDLLAVLSAKNAPNPLKCGEDLACAAAAGRDGEVDQILVLQMAKLGGDAVIRVSLVDSQSGSVLAHDSGVVPLGHREKQMQALVARLAAKLPAARPSSGESPEEEDAPVAPPVRLSAPTADMVAAPPPPPKPFVVWNPGRKVAAGLAAGSAATLLAGITMGAVALSLADPGTPPDPTLASRRATAQTLATGADIAYGVAAASAVAAVIVWFSSPESRNP